ncbi:MAG: hypothetical protein ACKOEH_11480 [Actinomycetota bacterium]
MDGTTNFLYALPGWSVSIGVSDKIGPLVAVNVSPSAGIYTTPTRGPILSLTPIDTLHPGSAYRKFVVPSIGSMHQVNSLDPR